MCIRDRDRYNTKYGFPKGTSHSKRDISKTTGIPMSILNEVYDRGLGARRSNPESVRRVSDGKKTGTNTLKGKYSGPAWGQSRIFSFVMKQKGTWSGADKDLSEKVKKLKIKGYMR